jgi:hypothetical protein
MSFINTREGRRAELRTVPEAREFMRTSDGWRVVSGRNGGGSDRCGLVAHRGVLHPDEYVDHNALRGMVERELGFTMAQLETVYRQGRKTQTVRSLRARIDVRLRAIRRAGGNLELLARVTGIDRKTIGRALARACVELPVACAWCEIVPEHGTGSICAPCAAGFGTVAV